MKKKKPPRGGTFKQARVELARKTALFTYTELRALVEKADKQEFADNNRFTKALENARQSIKPAITLRGYTGRFYEDGARGACENRRQPKPPEKAPSGEYLILLYLWLEAFFGSGEGKKLAEMGKQPDKQDVGEIASVLRVLDQRLTLSSEKDTIEGVLKKHVDDEHIVSCLAKWLPDLDQGA